MLTPSRRRHQLDIRRPWACGGKPHIEATFEPRREAEDQVQAETGARPRLPERRRGATFAGFDSPKSRLSLWLWRPWAGCRGTARCTRASFALLVARFSPPACFMGRSLELLGGFGRRLMLVRDGRREERRPHESCEWSMCGGRQRGQQRAQTPASDGRNRDRRDVTVPRLHQRHGLASVGPRRRFFGTKMLH
jgi:hypothetical protein